MEHGARADISRIVHYLEVLGAAHVSGQASSIVLRSGGAGKHRGYCRKCIGKWDGSPHGRFGGSRISDDSGSKDGTLRVVRPRLLKAITSDTELHESEKSSAELE